MNPSTREETALRWFVHGEGFPEPLIMVDLSTAGDNHTAGVEEFLYYLTDVQGSIGALANAAGWVVERYFYTPYGETKITIGDGTTQRTESLYGNPFAYTAQRYEPQTGLYHFWARVYSPTLGRFLQRDPQGLLTPGAELSLASSSSPSVETPSADSGSEYGDGVHLFGYVRGQPTMRTDPTGRFSLVDISISAGWSSDWEANNVDVGMSILGAFEGLVGLVNQRNLMLEAVAGLAATEVTLGGIDTALTVYSIYQKVQLARLGAGILKAAVNVTFRGVGSLLTRGMRSADNVPKSLLSGPKDTHVYLGRRDGRAVYAGITNDIPTRQRQHGDRFVIDAITTEPLTRRQARAIEQVLIERNPHFENKRNSISPMRDWYEDAVDWGTGWLTEKGLL